MKTPNFIKHTEQYYGSGFKFWYGFWGVYRELCVFNTPYFLKLSRKLLFNRVRYGKYFKV